MMQAAVFFMVSCYRNVPGMATASGGGPLVSGKTKTFV
jgi:hypothetical protein